MRATLPMLSLLSLIAFENVLAQTAPQRKALPPTPVTTTSAPQATAAAPAGAWKAVLRVVPNPLPAGRCATASVEIQDPDGYRATSLSNGAVIDFRHYLYTSSDTSTLKWQNGDPMYGIICAPANAAAARTTIGVTLPDGLTASVDLTTLAPGQTAAPVVYPVQARLRPATLPPAATTTMAAQPLAQAAQAMTPSVGPAVPNAPIGVSDPVVGSAQWPGTLTLGTVTTPAHLISGGGFTADVVLNDLGPTNYKKKHVANVRAQPIELAVQPSPAVANWINSSWSGSLAPMNGAVSAQPAAMTSVAGHVAFFEGVLTSTRIPELSGSKSSALTIRISAEQIKAGTSSPPAASSRADPISGFRFSVSGMSTSTVLKIASFEVATPAPVDQIGIFRESTRTQAPLVFPDIFVTIDERNAADWVAWYNGLVNGNHLEADERTFTLELLGANGVTPVATIKGYNVGIVSLRANPLAGGRATLEAELYVERMEFLAPGSKQ